MLGLSTPWARSPAPHPPKHTRGHRPTRPNTEKSHRHSHSTAAPTRAVAQSDQLSQAARLKHGWHLARWEEVGWNSVWVLCGRGESQAVTPHGSSMEGTLGMWPAGAGGAGERVGAVRGGNGSSSRAGPGPAARTALGGQGRGHDSAKGSGRSLQRGEACWHLGWGWAPVRPSKKRRRPWPGTSWRRDRPPSPAARVTGLTRMTSAAAYTWCASASL